MATTIAAGAPGVWLPAMHMTRRTSVTSRPQVLVASRTMAGPPSQLFVDENTPSGYVCVGGGGRYCGANRRVGGRGTNWSWPDLALTAPPFGASRQCPRGERSCASS